MFLFSVRQSVRATNLCLLGQIYPCDWLAYILFLIIAIFSSSLSFMLWSTEESMHSVHVEL